MECRFNEIYSEVSENEFEFLIEFLYQLTIFTRQVHSAWQGRELIDTVIQINEINHRVLNRIRDLKSFNAWSEMDYLLEMVPHHIAMAPDIEPGIGYAAEEAYERVFAEHRRVQ